MITLTDNLVFQKKKKSIHFPYPFPPPFVRSAYNQPRVDPSTEPFVWGEIQEEELVTFCRTKLFWEPQKTMNFLAEAKKLKDKNFKKDLRRFEDEHFDFQQVPKQSQTLEIAFRILREKRVQND